MGNWRIIIKDKMTIRADVAKNRMYMDLVGFFSDFEMQQVYNKFAAEVKKLHAGFDVITDISEFKPTTPDGAQKMGETQKLAKDLGLNRVIHIVRTEAGQVQVARKERELGINSDEATSVAEAEIMLDDAKKAAA